MKVACPRLLQYKLFSFIDKAKEKYFNLVVIIGNHFTLPKSSPLQTNLTS